MKLPQLTCPHLELTTRPWAPQGWPRGLFLLLSPLPGLTLCPGPAASWPSAHANNELLQVEDQGGGEAPSYWCSDLTPGLCLVTPFLYSPAGQEPCTDMME